MQYKTTQELFWKGEFGDDYVERNSGGLSNYLARWGDILSNTNNINSVIEFGANIGLNLKAIKILKPTVTGKAIEINHKAVSLMKADELLGNGDFEIQEESILDYESQNQYDLAFVSGVLIHINPDYLQAVYEKIYTSSSKYILICEYYNPSPVAVNYRGHEDRLFKRDFAGEFMDKYKDVKLLAYKFMYHRDNNFPCDDATWFLMEKL